MSRSLRNLESIGDRVEVPIPRDDHGFLGRECPQSECLGYFKVKPGTGLTGPGLQCHCPYCGHSGDPNTFWTPEQIEYAESVALRQVAEAVVKDLKQLEFNYPARGMLGIGISMKVQPGTPIPIRHYREKQLETDVICDKCTLHYSVFGLFGYCPDCRVHNSLQVLQRNLALVAKQVDLAQSLTEAELTRHLIEDALENCVSAFDGFGRETCRIRAAKSSNTERVASLSFQNLGRAVENISKYFGLDLKSAIAPDRWLLAERAFYKRHLIAHRSGVIDEQYRQASGDPRAIVGRRVVVTREEVTAVAETIEALAISMIDSLPLPS